MPTNSSGLSDEILECATTLNYYTHRDYFCKGGLVFPLTDHSFTDSRRRFTWCHIKHLIEKNQSTSICRSISYSNGPEVFLLCQ